MQFKPNEKNWLGSGRDYFSDLKSQIKDECLKTWHFATSIGSDIFKRPTRVAVVFFFFKQADYKPIRKKKRCLKGWIGLPLKFLVNLEVEILVVILTEQQINEFDFYSIVSLCWASFKVFLKDLWSKNKTQIKVYIFKFSKTWTQCAIHYTTLFVFT